MEKRAFDEMSELENSHWWFLGRRAIVSSIDSSFGALRKGSACLEIGFGTGGNIPFLSNVFRYVGVELNSYALNLARDKFPRADLRAGALPRDLKSLGEERFSHIFLLDVLEHVEEDELSLERVQDFLTDDGVLFLTVPAYRWMWSNHDEINHHKTRYTAGELEHKLEKAGYVVEYISYFNTLLFPLAVVQRFFGKFFKTIGGSVGKPGFGLNFVLYKIFVLEKMLIPRFRLPFGVSIIALARRQVAPFESANTPRH